MKPMEEILVPNTTIPTNNNNNNNLSKPSSTFEKRVTRPQKTAAAGVNCPRCDSINTKFCYYNNYSLSQPRYFCKTCRRYWTEGGTLRNIPVGGGSRKNKRSSSSSSSSSSFNNSSIYSLGSNKISNLVVPSASTAVLSQNPRIPHDQYGQDLNLGFPSTTSFNFDATKNQNSSALELLTGITPNSFMPVSVSDPSLVYTSMGQFMIPLPEFKIPAVSFSLDGSGGSCSFPFEELKSDTTRKDDDGDGGQSKAENSDSNGFWNGMMGGSSW